MSERRGIVFIGEDPDEADFLVWSGRFSAHWQSPDGEAFVHGPKGVSPDEAIQWGREQADVVVIRLGDSDVHYSAGLVPPSSGFNESPVPEWPTGRAVPRRRQPGFEHLDLVADDEIEWEVRMEPGPAVGAHPNHADDVRAAVEATPGASGVEVEAHNGDGLAVRFVVRARNHADALRQALTVQDRLLGVLPGPSFGVGGSAYVPLGFEPADGVRPVTGR